MASPQAKDRSQRARTESGSELKWKLEWKSGELDDPDSLNDVADPGRTQVKKVVEKVKNYKEDGTYKFWYIRSENRKHVKVVVSEGQPDSIMSMTGNAPALGMTIFMVGEAGSRLANKWKDLAAQIEEKGKSS